MDRKSLDRLCSLCPLLLAAVIVADVPVAGQVPAKPSLGMAEVTGNDVYVRCGASANHYPVFKLKAGDRVTVVGEQGDWFEVLPPQGAFSYVSGDFVDTNDGKSGVINGDRVNIRAGSILADYADLKYAVQTQLSKGAPVTILERLSDGFLRIEPPPGVAVWISRKFLEFVPNERARTSGTSGAVTPTASADQPAAEESTKKDVETGASDDSARLAGLPKSEHSKTLEQLDREAQSQLDRPVVDRAFAPLIERYEVVAGQDKDEFAQRYATTRVQQLTRMQELVERVRRVRQLSEDADRKRRAFLEDRAKIGGKLPPIPTGMEIQGELRPSALYSRTRQPQRFRLVDTKGGSERTLAYVEIPLSASIEVDTYVGRYVGVRASSRRLQTGGVDPIPIYVARQLVLLQSPESKSGGPGGS